MWRAPVFMKKIYYEKEKILLLSMKLVYGVNVKSVCFFCDQIVNKI